MKRKITALTKPNQKLIAVMVCLLLLIGACKKELLTSGEKIDPVLLKLNQGYVQNQKIKTINLNGFRDKVNMNALGTLKSSFTNTKANNNRTISVSTDETYLGFALHTDSIKMITDDGHIRYVFAVKSPSPRAVTFQNLTIDESAAGTIAFVVTYTPSRKWINDYKKGLLGKFEGERTVDFLDLKNGSPLPSPAKTATSGKTGSSTQGPPTTSNMVLECTMVNFYYYTAYQCATGTHWPGDPSCWLTGDARAGYTEHTSLEEVCSWVNNNPPPGGGGSTTNPPPGYDPCDGSPPPGGISSKKKTGNQIMVIPPNICDSVVVDCAGVAGGTAYTNPNCTTCMGGTTGITECPPADDPCDEKQKIETQENDITLIAIKNAILAKTDGKEWGAKYALNSPSMTSGYKSSALQTNGLTDRVDIDFSWNISEGYSIGFVHNHPGEENAPSIDDVLVLYQNVMDPELIAAGGQAFYKANSSLTVVTQSVKYAVKINNWANMAGKYIAYTNNTNNVKGELEMFRNTLIADKSYTEREASEAALLLFLGGSIDLFKAAPNSTIFKPLTMNTANQVLSLTNCP